MVRQLHILAGLTRAVAARLLLDGFAAVVLVAAGFKLADLRVWTPGPTAAVATVATVECAAAVAMWFGRSNGVGRRARADRPQEMREHVWLLQRRCDQV